MNLIFHTFDIMDRTSFAISFRSRISLGPSVGITYLERSCEDDYHELCIDLLFFSVIFLWR